MGRNAWFHKHSIHINIRHACFDLVSAVRWHVTVACTTRTNERLHRNILNWHGLKNPKLVLSANVISYHQYVIW